MALHVQEPTDFLIPNERPQEDLTESASRFSMLHLNNANHSPSPTSSDIAAAAGGSGHLHHHPPCTICGCQGFNPMKRRSPESELESSRPKKHSCEQEDQTQPSGYSAVSLPLSLENLAAIHNTRSALPVFRRCFSDPYTVPSAAGAPSTPNTSPENTPSTSRLPPRPPSLKRCVSDPSSNPSKLTFQESCLEDTGMGVDLSKEENSDLLRMKRMKGRLREMKKWWDEVMHEEEENQVEEGDKAMSVSQVDEGHKAVCVSQDYSGMEDVAEEFVTVEWVEKSLCVNFKCPCSKGYQILLSGNKCYYKLV
ncbi:hypothetical protein QN277_006058 [Acacia crassicarpa]|uniref:Uncharacterized protein n=1 Tax=Acacia crassicarpa TaxID=499986 RepID=A0AAE1IYE3_9FABA|nr:hypothetical protein QN277_006058 [Acacia crassicarpa]